mmetsp:Transcript_57522/g.113340  ORF Transcript_57522/g.113340 Transcript_57522/m.113340 type:complete len:218 (+) Transcript_57522:1582-2235(+)
MVSAQGGRSLSFPAPETRMATAAAARTVPVEEPSYGLEGRQISCRRRRTSSRRTRARPCRPRSRGRSALRRRTAPTPTPPRARKRGPPFAGGLLRGAPLPFDSLLLRHRGRLQRVTKCLLEPTPQPARWELSPFPQKPSESSLGAALGAGGAWLLLLPPLLARCRHHHERSRCCYRLVAGKWATPDWARQTDSGPCWIETPLASSTVSLSPTRGWSA